MDRITYTLPAEPKMHEEAARMIGVARGFGCEVRANYNGWELTAKAADHPIDVLRSAHVCDCCGETFAPPAVLEEAAP